MDWSLAHVSDYSPEHVFMNFQVLWGDVKVKANFESWLNEDA